MIGSLRLRTVPRENDGRSETNAKGRNFVPVVSSHLTLKHMVALIDPKLKQTVLHYTCHFSSDLCEPDEDGKVYRYT